MANLAAQIKNLPADVRGIIEQSAAKAQGTGYRLYLVGGVVRDLLLGRPTCDIDLAVAGDAIALAEALDIPGARLVVHHAFGTATLSLPGLELDLTTVRSESYARPAILPTVAPGSLKDDLFRRDFTINAMAVSLNAADYGTLFDYYGGQKDLKSGLIRVLHPQSFRDDPTRIWRAARYEQRLGFSIEPDTLALARRDLSHLGALSGDRAWYEMECVLGEAEPEQALMRLDALGALSLLPRPLRADGWLEQKFSQARLMCGRPSPALYLALLTCRLNEAAVAELTGYWHLTRTINRILQDTQRIKANMDTLARPGIKPGAIYRLLHGCAAEALTANVIARDDDGARRSIELYQQKLRLVKTALRGGDLIGMGVPPGPRVREMLDRLLEARLDGLVASRAAEETWLKTNLLAD